MSFWFDDVENWHFPDPQDEQRYIEDLKKPEIDRELICISCNKVLITHNAHVLVSLWSGCHITAECLQKLEDWVIEEEQRRITVKWTGKT